MYSMMEKVPRPYVNSRKVDRIYSMKRHTGSFEIRSFLEDVKQKQPQMLNQYLSGRISRGDSVNFGSTIK